MPPGMFISQVNCQHAQQYFLRILIRYFVLFLAICFSLTMDFRGFDRICTSSVIASVGSLIEGHI